MRAEVERLTVANRAAAMQAIADGAQAQEALERALAAEAEVELLKGERDDALRRSMDWQGNYEALVLAIVGDTGASAILEAEKLRAEAARLSALLDEATKAAVDVCAQDAAPEYAGRYADLRTKIGVMRATLAKIGGQHD